MPYVMRKLPKQDLYRVYNAKTKEVHSYGTTLENAKKQITLLNMIDAGVPLDKTESSVAKKKGGAIAEDDTLLRPFFARIGSKVSILRDILPIIPPHKIYVEPFVGGGAVFWNKEQAEKSVINDLDKQLIQGYRILKKISPNTDVTILDNSKKVGKKYPEVEKFIAGITSKSSDRDKLIATEKIYSGSFGSTGSKRIYKNAQLGNKWNKISQYQDRLKRTTILNQDYTKVIKEYDSPDTFFFLDPPYEKSEKYYVNGVIDYPKMNELLKTIKGKFLLSINDSKYIRDVFKGFNFRTIVVRNPSTIELSDKIKNRKELFISNYNIMPSKKGKGVETDLFDNERLGQPVSIPEINSIDVILPTYMYKRLPDIKKKDGTMKPPQYRFRLVTPTTKARNLASRMRQNVVNLERKPVASPSADIEPQILGELPKLKEFSPADRKKIEEYYKQVKAEEKKDKKDIPNQPTNNRQRGFPLPCDKQSDGVSPRPKKVKAPKEQKPVGRPKADKITTEKKPRGRPKKQPKKIQIINPEVVLEEGDVVFPDGSSISELSSLAKDKTISSSSKSSKSKSSKSSASSIDTDNISLDDADVEDFLTKYGIKKGKGIENKISTKSIGMNSWIQHTKQFAAKKGIKYNEALKDPENKASYKKGAGVCMGCPKGYKCGGGIIDEAAAAGYADQVLIADAYNQKNLGAQKRYISL